MDIKALISAANETRGKAYAPYSNFTVGAAIIDEKGNVHSGCNVENAAYPQSQCAEATAIGTMIANGGREISAIVIAGPENGSPCTPCGGCRQRIREFASPRTAIIICSDEKILAEYSITDLLPDSFGPENLT